MIHRDSETITGNWSNTRPSKTINWFHREYRLDDLRLIFNWQPDEMELLVDSTEY
jgi:hypothetical protein